jgi:hypothetical protein
MVMTPKDKQKYFKLSYDYWMDWKTKPEEDKSPLERLGCYVNLFSMLENRLRVLYWTASFYVPFDSVLIDHKKSIWKGVSRKQMEKNTEDPYPSEKSSEIKLALGHIINALGIHVFSNKQTKYLKDENIFRNKLTHTAMFKLDLITDEKVEELISHFRFVDKTLKQRRRFYIKREKEQKGTV